MKIHKVKTYSLNELSEEAQQVAHENYLHKMEWNWTDELEATLKTFAKVFPIKIKNWAYDSNSADVQYETTCSTDIDALKGIRLAAYIWNNFKSDLYKGKYYLKNGKHRYSKIILDNSCPLTGVCFDDDILEPIYKFLDKPDPHTDFYDLMKECIRAWENAAKKELESQLAFEYFFDTALANEYEYTENGRLFFM